VLVKYNLKTRLKRDLAKSLFFGLKRNCTEKSAKPIYNNQATNACELKAYSGCGAYGFATEVDCKDCACN
jgi:hypothetical protein